MFAAVIAVLLIGTGVFLYLRLGTTLTATVDSGLRTRAGDAIALAAQSDSVLTERRSPLTEQGESLTQILDASGRVVDATPEVRDRSLLHPAQVEVAARGTLVTQVPPGDADRDELRLLATPAQVDGRRRVVVVATSLESVQEAQQALGRSCCSAGPCCCSSPVSRATPQRPPRCVRSSRCAAAPPRYRRARRGSACRWRRRTTRSAAWGTR